MFMSHRQPYSTQMFESKPDPESVQKSVIDRNHKIHATDTSGKLLDEYSSVLFSADDPALPSALEAYRAKLKELGASQDQLESVACLQLRVLKYQS